MKIAIHSGKYGFRDSWIDYCTEQNIPFKMVDCYSNSIIKDLEGCDALFWQINQSNSKDIVIAKSLLFALEHTGFKVFPDFNTAWHFDDKAGQKYLFERLKEPFVPSYLFFDKKTALDWVKQTTFPKVFKLRGGAGSKNVSLAKTKREAVSLINKAFGSGFKQYDAISNLKERFRKYRDGKTNFTDVLKGITRLAYEPQFSKIIGKERGYAYFQDFIPQNTFDIRIIVIDEKAFGLKRMVRRNDFRASGSGEFRYGREEFDERCVDIAFRVAEKTGSQSAALDFVFDPQGQPLLVEISFGFVKEVHTPCPGYWDKNFNWVEGSFNPCDWMIDSVIKSLKKQKV